MKSRALTIPMVLAVTATLANPSFAAEKTDGQAQAAVLLSRPWMPVIPGAVSVGARVTASTDGHASAAALLSRPRTDVNSPARFSLGRLSDAGQADGQARAATLLSRPRSL
jgi:hypothetical protein